MLRFRAKTSTSAPESRRHFVCVNPLRAAGHRDDIDDYHNDSENRRSDEEGNDTGSRPSRITRRHYSIQI